MTTLRPAPYTLPAADLRTENPLPMFRGTQDDVAVDLDESVPEEDRRYMGWRIAHRVLPHRMQDDYTRRKRVRKLDSLVLENAHLRAVFLPQYGGRLVSLVHHATNRELLARNPVFQPANLALRNAWFSGGIEWNSGQCGHHYLTCSPVFAAEVEGPEGEPCLRLYEWDRVKGYYWQIDFFLPHDSDMLFARIRIVNPHDDEIAMYWWSNIAVEEREDVRVLAPAETALCNPYWKAMGVVELPVVAGHDVTYSTRTPHAFDFFSRIPDERRRWVAALDAAGSGFFEASTDRLRGRKLFCWGNGAGGRRWQEFLAAPGHAYIEIQAGLARTQMESVPMPARAEWTFTEAFGYLQADPRRVHGDDWAAAWGAAAEEIERRIPRARLEELDARLAAVTARPPVRVLRNGSGWGALEQARREACGEGSRTPDALPFAPSTMGPDQAPWHSLLRTGALPERDPAVDPGALMVQPEWRTLLESSVRTPGGDHWLSWWHLGNLRMEARDLDGAEEAWERSLALRPTGWALRNLAVAAKRRGETHEALERMDRAWSQGPKVVSLAVEYAQELVTAERFGDVLRLVSSLPERLRAHDRVRLLWAKAALETGELDGVERIFDHEFATIREGEVTLTDLWFALHERRVATAEGVPIDSAVRARVRREFPPPRHIDFRMADERQEGAGRPNVE
jgi:hypothetical protein